MLALERRVHTAQNLIYFNYFTLLSFPDPFWLFKFFFFLSFHFFAGFPVYRRFVCWCVENLRTEEPLGDFIFIANKWYNFLPSLSTFPFWWIFFYNLFTFLFFLFLVFSSLVANILHRSRTKDFLTLWLIQETSFSSHSDFYFSLQEVLEKKLFIWNCEGERKSEKFLFFAPCRQFSNQHSLLQSLRARNYKILTKGRKESKSSPTSFHHPLKWKS